MTFSSATLLSQLPPQLPQTASGGWWVALSGGLDSCVLLHSLATLELPVKLRALHVNHQISPKAKAWQQHCADLCECLGIPFTAVSVEVKNTGRGIEDAAREARYEVFKQHIAGNDYLLTAHHADDQAETLLLRLMRGTGPRGLAAISTQRPLAAGILYRPLLRFTRAELESYALAQGLTWVNDESNGDDHYDRNYLRNQVMPLLRERWPAFTHKWQQTADLCAVNEALIEELAESDLARADFKAEFIGTSVSLAFLQDLSVGRRHNLLRYWLRTQSLSTPEQQHLDQVERQLMNARQDAQTQVTWGDVSLRVFRQRVFALPRVDLPNVEDLPLVSAGLSELAPINDLPTGFRLTVESCSSHTTPLLETNLPDLHCRYRQGGERCKPIGRAHSQTLKRLLQDYAVEPWLRDSLPLIYSADRLVAVADLWICEGFQAEASGYRLKYERIPRLPTSA